MTTENIFSAVLTLSLLAGGAVAFGSDAARTPQAPAMVATATLPTVTVIGHRAAAATVAKATLPTVTVVGRRVAPTAVAIETESVEQRVQ